MIWNQHLAGDGVDVAAADVQELVVVPVAEGEEQPAAVVGSETARPERDVGGEAVLVVGAAAAQDADEAERAVRVRRGENEPRQRRRRGRHGLGLDEAVDPVVPRLADEGHVAAVVLARDAAEDQEHEVVGNPSSPRNFVGVSGGWGAAMVAAVGLIESRR